MKVSKEQMAENRERILNAAAQLFREKGFDCLLYTSDAADE